MPEAEPITITEMSWRGLPAWRLDGAKLSVVVSRIGAHLAALTARDDACNALWQPTWPAADPATVRPDPDSPYGNTSEAAVLAGTVGSMLCLPRFGAPAPGETGAAHGEAPVVPWTHRGAGVFTAHLVESDLAVERRFQLTGDEVILTTTTRNAGRDSRDIGWCEHITLGGDFLEGLGVTAGIDRTFIPMGMHNPRFRFPGCVAEVDPGQVLAVPQDADGPSHDVVAGRVATGWWRAANPRLGWCLEAAWDREAFPWLVVWTQHRERQVPPWLGRERTRGLEISTQPFPEGRPPAIRAETFQGRPTLCRLAPGASLAKTVRLRWSRTERRS